jgi:hypothetical protein
MKQDQGLQGWLNYLDYLGFRRAAVAGRGRLVFSCLP